MFGISFICLLWIQVKFISLSRILSYLFLFCALFVHWFVLVHWNRFEYVDRIFTLFVCLHVRVYFLFFLLPSFFIDAFLKWMAKGLSLNLKFWHCTNSMFVFYFSQLKHSTICLILKSMTSNSEIVKILHKKRCRLEFYVNCTTQTTQTTEYGHKNMLCYCHKNMLLTHLIKSQ